MPGSILRAGVISTLLFASMSGTTWAYNQIVIDAGPTDAAVAYRLTDKVESVFMAPLDFSPIK